MNNWLLITFICTVIYVQTCNFFVTIIYSYKNNLQLYTVNLMLLYLTISEALFDCRNPVIKNIMIITIYIYIPFSFHISLNEYTSLYYCTYHHHIYVNMYRYPSFLHGVSTVKYFYSFRTFQCFVPTCCVLLSSWLTMDIHSYLLWFNIKAW